MIATQFIKKLILSLLPLLVIYFLKQHRKKNKKKTSFNVDKNKIEEGELI